MKTWRTSGNGRGFAWLPCELVNFGLKGKVRYCRQIYIETYEKKATICFFVFCVVTINDHGGRRGNTVQVIDQWQHPVAMREALVVLHRAIRATSHRRIRMVIEMASKPCVLFFIVN